MNLALGIPFRSDDPTRVSALVTTMEELAGLAPWDEIKVFSDFHTSLGGLLDPGSGQFKRGMARNNAVRYFTDADVIVLCDADSYPQQAPLMRAILGAAFDGKIHFPFDTVHQLDGLGRLDYSYGPSAGGCYVFRPDAWKRMGWMEERGGWSVDDRTFLEQMKTFGGGPVYHPGVLTSLWHTTEARTRSVPVADKVLIQAYLDASGDQERMRRLVENRRSI